MNLPKQVRYDAALGQSGVFRPLPAGKRRPRLYIEKTYGRYLLRWSALEAPGIPEQTLLLVLQALASKQDRQLADPPQTPLGQRLRDGLHCEGALLPGTTAVVSTTLYQLALCCGYREAGGSTQRQLKESLRRLAGITVWSKERDSEVEGASRLLAVHTDAEQRLHLALNRRLSIALWEEQHYCTISLEERRQLSSQYARALHTYLASSIDPDKHWHYGWPSLTAAIWGKATSASTLRGHKSKLREALAEIDQLANWSIHWEGDKVTLKHHR